jgi:wyosine [tRNA(Phe)-imidazoG37] synthetase (radical SAM superfamily)
MEKTIYEPIDESLDRPVTKADVEKILRAIEILSEQINNQ